MAIEKELTIQDYIEILRRRWPLIVVLAVVGVSVGFVGTKVLPKKYKSSTLVLVEQPAISGIQQVVSSDTSERFASMQEQIMSRSRLEPVIQRFQLYKDDLNTVPMDELVLRLRKAIDVTPIQPMAETRAQGLPGFTISVSFDDAHRSQEICSTITSMFMEQNLQLQQQKAKLATDFLVTQLDDAKAKLDQQDARLAAFQRAHLGSLPDDRNTNLNVLGGLAAQLDATTQALSRAQQDKTFAESSLGEQLAAWQATLGGRNPETDAQQLAVMQAQLAELKSRYTDNHPDVVRLKRDIAAAKKAEQDKEKKSATAVPLSAEEPPQIKALRDRIHQYEVEIGNRSAQQDDIRGKIKLYQERMESTPAVEQEYKALTRDYQTAVENYNDLLKKRDAAQMAAALQQQQQGEQFRVLDPANLPDKPSFPNPLLFSVGGLGGGLACAVGLIGLLEMRDTSVRSDKEVENLLHLPVLAMVPTVAGLSDKAKAMSVPSGPLARVQEQPRRTRTQTI
jgi:protein tyrosine kinase modulator